MKKLGVPRSTLYRWAADPNHPFPKPIKLSEKVSGWTEEELDQWIADCARASRGVEPAK